MLTDEQVQKRVNAVVYKCQGKGIKHALYTNPGKIIVRGRQTGKTTQLAEYVYEQHPEGVILFCLNEHTAKHLRDQFPRDYFMKSIVAWPHLRAPFFPGEDYPIFADEILLLPTDMQELIVRDYRFIGAVSSISGMFVSNEIKNLCVVQGSW